MISNATVSTTNATVVTGNHHGMQYFVVNGNVYYPNQATNTTTAPQWQLMQAAPVVMPPPRAALEFNRYLNASDLLEEFIRYCGTERVTKQELMKLPMELFIKWLIVSAAEADQEPAPPDIKLVEDLRNSINQLRHPPQLAAE